jgi:hypothetical protein
MNKLALVLCPEMAASLWQGQGPYDGSDLYMYDLVRPFNKGLTAEQKKEVEGHPMYQEMLPFYDSNFIRDKADKTALEHMQRAHPFVPNQYGHMDMQDKLDRMQKVPELAAPLTTELAVAYNRKSTKANLAYEVQRLNELKSDLEIILANLSDAAELLAAFDSASVDDNERLAQLRLDLKNDLSCMERDPLYGAVESIAENTPKRKFDCL